MRQFSVVKADNFVVIDGIAKPVDCSSLDPTIHAIQWNEERQKGHIEFVDEDPNDGICEPNINIDSIAPYQFLIEAWQAYVPPEPEPLPLPAPIEV
jgi:hypothetical protein